MAIEPFGVGFRDTETGGLLAKRPEATMPQFNLGRVAALTQEQQAPALSSLRRGLQGIQAGRFSSPTARSEAIRGGFRGFGEALPAIQAGATRTALSLYQPQLQLEIAEFQEMQRQKEREEDIQSDSRLRRTARSETRAEAQARLASHDPFGASARFDERPFEPFGEGIQSTRFESGADFPSTWMQ